MVFGQIYLKKYAANISNEKSGFAALCSQRVFRRGGVYKISLALLNFGHLFLSIFAERCHFFSGLFKE
jgi:hypothetical protein